MPILKAYHQYVRKPEFKKQSYGIAEIIPIEDREVKQALFDQYDDITINTMILQFRGRVDYRNGKI